MKGSGLSKQTGSRLAQEAGSMPGSTGDNNHGMQAKEGGKTSVNVTASAPESSKSNENIQHIDDNKPGSAGDGPDRGEVVDPTSPWLEDIAAFSGVGRALRVLANALDSLAAGSSVGLPPEGLVLPAEGPFSMGPSSRSSDPGKSLWDASGGEWRYFPGDKYHNPHWDYNPWNHSVDQWRNVPINDLPPVK